MLLNLWDEKSSIRKVSSLAVIEITYWIAKLVILGDIP